MLDASQTCGFLCPVDPRYEVRRRCAWRAACAWHQLRGPFRREGARAMSNTRALRSKLDIQIASNFQGFSVGDPPMQWRSLCQNHDVCRGW